MNKMDILLSMLSYMITFTRVGTSLVRPDWTISNLYNIIENIPLVVHGVGYESFIFYLSVTQATKPEAFISSISL